MANLIPGPPPKTKHIHRRRQQEAVHAAQALQQVAEQANNEILAEQERVKARADPSRYA